MITEEKRYPSRRKSAKKKVNPVLKNVVSLRVSDQEKLLLENLTRSTSQNVSDLVREALGFWLSKRGGAGRAAGRTFRQGLS